MTNYLKEAALVLFAMIMLDLVFAFYIIETAARAPAAAGGWSAAIILLSGFVTRSYVDNKWMIIPAAVGAFIGTFIAVWYFP